MNAVLEEARWRRVHYLTNVHKFQLFMFVGEARRRKNGYYHGPFVRGDSTVVCTVCAAATASSLVVILRHTRRC